MKGGSGYAIGYTQEGEWLEYTVNVAEAGEYGVSASYATSSENAGVKLYIDDKAVTDNVIFPQGSDWETYSTFDAGKVNLTVGEHVLKLEIVGNYVNIDYLEFCAGAKCEAAVTPDDSSSANDSTLAIAARYNVNFEASQTYGVYGLDGRLVAKFTTVGTENLRARTAESVRLSGTYLVKPFHGGRTYRIAVQK